MIKVGEEAFLAWPDTRITIQPTLFLSRLSRNIDLIFDTKANICEDVHSFLRDITKTKVSSPRCTSLGHERTRLTVRREGRVSLHFHADWDCSRIRSNFYRKVSVEVVGESSASAYAFTHSVISINQRRERLGQSVELHIFHDETWRVCVGVNCER